MSRYYTLARMLHERNEVQGKCGKQDLSIARECIAIAMDQGGSAKIAYVDTQIIRFAHGAGSGAAGGPASRWYEPMEGRR